MSAPQALIDSLGRDQDIAKANRTVHDLAGRVTKIKQLHMPGETVAPGICRACLDVWPCKTYHLANGR